MRRSRTEQQLSHRHGPPREAGGALQQPVDDQVDADRQERDRRAGHQRRRDAEDDAVLVVLHHAAPVGRRRLDAEAEEGERREEQEGEAEAQAELGEQRRQRVGQDLAEDDPAGPSPRSRAASTKSITATSSATARAEAEDARRIEDRHDEDQDPEVCGSTARTTSAKISVGIAIIRSLIARQQLVDPAADDGGDEAQHDADREGEERRGERDDDRRARRRRSAATACRGRDCRCRAGTAPQAAPRRRRPPRSRRRVRSTGRRVAADERQRDARRGRSRR